MKSIVTVSNGALALASAISSAVALSPIQQVVLKLAADASIDLQLLASSAGANMIGFDSTATYDSDKIGSAVQQCLDAIVDLQGQTGQLVVSAPDTNGVVTVSFANPATFPGPVTIPGRTDGTSAAAGAVGEYQEIVISSGSAIALTTTTPTEVCHLVLPAGDWDVGGSVCFSGTTSTSVTYLYGGLNTANNALPSLELVVGSRIAGTQPLATDVRYACTNRRVLSNSSTTISLMAQASFSASTCSAYGKIWARRRA
jgi:hypothetical protein